MIKPKARDILVGVLFPLLLLMLVMGAIAYAINENIHDAASQVKQEALVAVDKKATAGKNEILEEVKKQTEATEKLGEQFEEHRANANQFREKTLVFQKKVRKRLELK